MRVKLDTVYTTVLVLCALVITGVLIRREFFPSHAAAPEEKPVFMASWRDHLSKGERIGPAEAPVQLIEFADFECPYCASFHKRLKALQERYPAKVALTYVHFPLPFHRFAEPAARAAECAGAQGRFEDMSSRLFEQQNEFGLKPWGEMASEAGVPDLGAFEACVKNKDPIPRVVEGRQLGEKLNIRGTPTIIVNGWKLGRPPAAKELEDMVKAVLSGNSPVVQKS